MIKVVCRALYPGQDGNPRCPSEHWEPATVLGCGAEVPGTAEMGFYDNSSPQFVSIWHPSCLGSNRSPLASQQREQGKRCPAR